MQPLLLPEPHFHECLFCRITSHYVADEDVSSTGRRTLFFVEHCIDQGKQDEVLWSLCDLCEAERAEKYYNRDPEISVHRGSADWSGDHQYFGFETMPMVCVSTANGADYRETRERDHETWLYCRTRAEWRSAWQIARIIVKNGNRPERFQHLLNFLPAWKMPGGDLTVHPEVLNGTRRGGNTLLGLCDGCGIRDIVVVEPGTQWANCEDCQRKAAEHRLERGEA